MWSEWCKSVSHERGASLESKSGGCPNRLKGVGPCSHTYMNMPPLTHVQWVGKASRNKPWLQGNWLSPTYLCLIQGKGISLALCESSFCAGDCYAPRMVFGWSCWFFSYLDQPEDWMHFLSVQTWQSLVISCPRARLLVSYKKVSNFHQQIQFPVIIACKKSINLFEIFLS